MCGMKMGVRGDRKISLPRRFERRYESGLDLRRVLLSWKREVVKDLLENRG